MLNFLNMKVPPAPLRLPACRKNLPGISARAGAEVNKSREWISDGVGSYSTGPAEELPRGTRIILELKDEPIQH